MRGWVGAGVALLMAAGAGPALAAASRHTLPAEVSFPEGVAYDPASRTLYTAGAQDGRIARIDARTGRATSVAAPEVAAQIGTAFPGALGMKLDPRGRLWIAGGRTGKVFVVAPRTGRLIQTVTTPGTGGLINDIAFAGGRAYFTDTLRPTLWAVDAGAEVPVAPEAFLTFPAGPLQYGEGANLNGILATADGKTLLTGQMAKGLLFKIDVASRQVSAVPIGGEKVEGVDGLVLNGRTLYVIRQPAAEIVTVQLAPDLSWGGVVKRTKAPGLLWPATGVLVGNELVVVNTQFNKRTTGDAETPFSLERVPLSQLAGG